MVRMVVELGHIKTDIAFFCENTLHNDIKIIPYGPHYHGNRFQ